ncbi:MAG: rhomboid family intramembrane serine protease [Bacillota bacterium]|jgi:membrane associated rhomboid family serine protease
MIPIRDTQRSRTRPVVNWLLILVNLLVFIYELGLSDRALNLFTVKYGVIPAVLTDSGSFTRETLMMTSGWFSLVTSLFVHVGWVHVLGNLMYLFIFGDNVEDRMGHGRYLAFYLTSGIIASLAHVFSSPSSTVPTVGASGAIAGVLGAYFVMFPRARVLALIPIGFFLPMIEVPSIVFLFLWFITNLFSGVASLGATAQGGVAWWAHIGGFVAGMVLAFVFRRPRRSRV